MELRHLRYFIAVAEEGSLTVAAERRLFTAQPSLSRQMRDLEEEIGTSLMTRSTRGIELTPAGKVFLEHARLALAQVEHAAVAARNAATPAKSTFALGFLTGQEMAWLPQAMYLLRDELPKINVTVSSQFSPGLAHDLITRQLDVAFMRPESNAPDLAFKAIAKEALVIVLPSDHRLAAKVAIDPADIASETFIHVSHTAPTLRIVIDQFLKRHAIHPPEVHEIDNLAMAISMVASTRGVSILPAYAQNFLPWSVVSRPLLGDAPLIDLVLGYRRDNQSPLLKLLLSRADEMVARARKDGLIDKA